jgi:hypothetical protein
MAEMFPPQVMVTFAACHFLAIWFALEALDGIAPVRLTWASARGIATVALILIRGRIDHVQEFLCSHRPPLT